MLLFCYRCRRPFSWADDLLAHNSASAAGNGLQRRLRLIQGGFAPAAVNAARAAGDERNRTKSLPASGEEPLLGSAALGFLPDDGDGQAALGFLPDDGDGQGLYGGVASTVA